MRIMAKKSGATARKLEQTKKAPAGKKGAAKTSAAGNPLLAPWNTPFEMPPFDKIRTRHYMPAFEVGFEENIAEIDAIAGEKAKPTFANTIEALERAGRRLEDAAGVFYNLSSADTNAEMQKIEREVAPRFAKHGMRVYQNAKLFKRVDALMKQRKSLGLTLEKIARAGALSQELHPLRRRARCEVTQAHGGDRAEARHARHQVRPERAGGRAGLPAGAGERAGPCRAVAGAARGGGADGRRARHKGKHAISLARSSVEPFLQFSARRDLREQAFKAWRQRGAKGGKTDNRKLIAEILALRAERSHLLGFKTSADAALEFTMAKTARQRAQAADAGVGAGARACARGARGTAEGRGGGRRQLRGGGLGLALLRGEGAQDQVRRRRGGGEALPAARQRDRGGVRRGDPPVRPQVRRAHRPARLSSRRARLRGDGQGRPPHRPVPRRLLRAAVKAFGRMDVRLPRPVQVRRQGGAPDRRQRGTTFPRARPASRRC